MRFAKTFLLPLALLVLLAGCDSSSPAGEDAAAPQATEQAISSQHLTGTNLAVSGTLAADEEQGTLRLRFGAARGATVPQDLSFSPQEITYRAPDGEQKTHVLSRQASRLLTHSLESLQEARTGDVPEPLQRLEARLAPSSTPAERAEALKDAGFSVEAMRGARYRVEGTPAGSGLRTSTVFDLGDDGGARSAQVLRGTQPLARLTTAGPGTTPRVESLPPDGRVSAARPRSPRHRAPGSASIDAPPTGNLAAGGQRHVAFVHGLFGDEGSWDDTRALFQDELDISSSNKAYSSASSINETATDYPDGLPDGSIYVGHSMGGLVSREVYRQYGAQKVDALITLGTPHLGAPLAANVDDVGDVTDGWLDDLAAGPSYQLGGPFGSTVYSIISGAVSFGDVLGIVENLVTGIFDSTGDLAPGSAFLDQLGTATPPLTYAVRSREDATAPVRLADASLNDGVETGTGIALYQDAGALYGTLYATAQANADEYLDSYDDTSWWRFVTRAYYWERYSYWSGVAAGYARGVTLLNGELSRQWQEDLIGVEAGTGGGRADSDGIVPYESQAPGFIPPEFRLSAQGGVNHLEQVNNAETRDRLRFALRQLGVQAR